MFAVLTFTFFDYAIFVCTIIKYIIMDSVSPNVAIIICSFFGNEEIMGT